MNQFDIFDEIADMQPGDESTFSKGRWSDNYDVPATVLIPKWCVTEYSPMEGRKYEVTEEKNYYKINRVS